MEVFGERLGVFGNVLGWRSQGTFGSVLERLEECWKRVLTSLGPYGSVWQVRPAGQHNPICMHSFEHVSIKA